MPASSLEQPGMMDLFKQLTGSTGATTASDATAVAQNLDPSSPDILKAIAAKITKLKEGGDAPDPETVKTLGASMKAHMDYTANLSLLTQLNKAYTAKYGSQNGSTK